MLCSFCEGLSIEGLVELAKREYNSGFFPHDAFYQHHASIEDLVSSAKSGCELCHLFVSSAALTPVSLNPDEEFTFLEFCQQLEMRSTDVKVAIHALHTDTDEGFEDVQLFDALQVWFGPNPHHEYQEMEDYCQLMFAMNINITVPRDQPIKLGEYRIGRYQLDPNLSSKANFDIARTWFAACCTEHSNCSPRRMTLLPTRLVDVGEAPDFHVRLVLTLGQHGEYAALSHCWGGSIESKLVNEKLHDYLEALPLSDLPANFKDAIIIAREMGLRYIWIDSLCIIQDSTHDWKVESAKMAELYLNAAFTICAAASESNNVGILAKASSGQNEALQVTQPEPRGSLRLFPPSSPDNTTVCLSRHRPSIGSLDDPRWECVDETMLEIEAYGPLGKRAWALQEKMLSPRRLVYGNQQIYWVCVEGCQSSDGLPDCFLTAKQYEYISIMRLFHSPSLQDWSELSASEIGEIHSEFYSMVSGNYSHRKLTYLSDRLPAFAGLAKKMHPLFGGTYLAGIWSSDIHRGIAWYIHDGPYPHIPVRPYRAPSWSWACAEYDVSFVFDCGNAARLCSCVDYAKLELLDFHVDYWDKNNPYGRVNEASLCVRGRTRPLLRFRASARPRNTENSKPVSTMGFFDDCTLKPRNLDTADVEGRTCLLWELEEPLDEPTGWYLFPLVPEKDYIIIVVESSHSCYPRYYTDVISDHASVTTVPHGGDEEWNGNVMPTERTTLEEQATLCLVSRMSTFGEVSGEPSSPASASTSPGSWADVDTDSQNGSFWTEGEEELADSGLEFLYHSDWDVAGSETDGGGAREEEEEARTECLVLERDLEREDVAYIKVGIVSIFEPMRFLEDWEVTTLTLI